MLPAVGRPDALHGGEHLLDGQAVQAEIIGIDALAAEEALAGGIRLDEFAQSVQVPKFVGIENVVDENDLLPERQRQVHSHRNAGNDEITLVHQRNKLREIEISEVLRDAVRAVMDIPVSGVFVRTAEQEHVLSGGVNAVSEFHPLLDAPEAGGPAGTGSRIEANDGSGMVEPGKIFAIGNVKNILFIGILVARDFEEFGPEVLSVGEADIIENSGEELGFRLVIHGSRFSKRSQREPGFLLGTNSRCQGAGIMVLIEIEQPIELDGMKNFEVFGFPGHDPVDLGTRHEVRRMSEPPDAGVGMIPANRREQRSGAENIPRCSQLNDEDVLLDRIIVGASIAMDAFALVRRARNIAAEIPAVLMNDQ